MLTLFIKILNSNEPFISNLFDFYEYIPLAVVALRKKRTFNICKVPTIMKLIIIQIKFNDKNKLHENLHSFYSVD